MNTTERPINLNLMKLKFPVTAIASILHRISGILLFLGLPLLIYMLDRSLKSNSSFMQLETLMHSFWMRLGVWIVVCAVIYHLLAGIRHLLMDMGVGESLKAGRATAMTVILLSVVGVILAGVWIW